MKRENGKFEGIHKKYDNRWGIIGEILNRDPIVNEILDKFIGLYDYCHNDDMYKEKEDEINKLYIQLSNKYHLMMSYSAFIKDVKNIKERYEECFSGKELYNPLNYMLVKNIKNIILEMYPYARFDGEYGKFLIHEILEKIVPKLFYVGLVYMNREILLEKITPIVRQVLYEIETDTYIGLSDEEKKSQIRLALRNFLKWDVYSFDWSFPLQSSIDYATPGEGTWARYLPTDNPLPVLTITVDLSRIHLIGITKAVDIFQTLLHNAVESIQLDARMAFPEALAFLRTISAEDWERDLRRFDLHMQDGLTFRQIALREKLEQQGKPLPPSLQSITVGQAVEGEDGVEKSVKRLYQAIYRTPYRARRKRLDAPAQGMEVYACPEHPAGECPEKCPYLQNFMKRFDAQAPTANTGRGKQWSSRDVWDTQETARVLDDSDDDAVDDSAVYSGLFDNPAEKEEEAQDS
jgi:hypothetical protein